MSNFASSHIAASVVYVVGAHFIVKLTHTSLASDQADFALPVQSQNRAVAVAES